MLKYMPYTYPDPIDQELINWLSEEIKIEELKKTKTLSKILSEDVSPNIHGFVEKLDVEEFVDLYKRNLIDSEGQLRLLGKGYIACLMANLESE
ncbi:MAG: hypothetical protein R6W90_07785 [Ignavibacteriaceae bacterium]